MEIKEETVSVSKFKATCLGLLKKVKRTRRSVLITRRGEPIARVVPLPPPARPASWLGSFRTSGKIIGDVVSPALSDSDWDALK